MADSSQARVFWKADGQSVHACWLVAVESDSRCPHPSAVWTDEGLGWRWLGCCSHFLPPVFFLCGFVPLCLELTTDFSHWWVPAVSIWGVLLPWLMADSRLCKLSLQLVFVTLSWSTPVALSFLELAEEDCLDEPSCQKLKRQISWQQVISMQRFTLTLFKGLKRKLWFGRGWNVWCVCVCVGGGGGVRGEDWYILFLYVLHFANKIYK